VEGVLKSWAVPKGPSTDPKDKRLAVMVEDHPLDYADFEGVIPEGQYGAGTVLVWDRGTYRSLMPEGVSVAEALARGQVAFYLEGKRLRGGYVLVRTKIGSKPPSGPYGKNWLLIKMKDTSAARSP